MRTATHASEASAQVDDEDDDALALAAARARIEALRERRQTAHARATQLVQLSVRVDQRLRQRVRAAALVSGLSVQDLVTEALEAYLDVGVRPDTPAAEDDGTDDWWEGVAAVLRSGEYKREADEADPETAIG